MLYSTTGAGAHPQVTGLAVSRKHGVLLSLHGGGENGTRNQVLQFRPLEWSLERHRLFPEGFKVGDCHVAMARGGKWEYACFLLSSKSLLRNGGYCPVPTFAR
jgi:hypothetical protein